ncbi:MAG TPA: YceI family protein [Caulobacteraceae bacterium]|jgi:polyisoprenoid-binding protein YceI
MSFRRTLAICLALALATPAAAAPSSQVSDIAAGHYVLDPRHGSVMAKVLHMGVSIYTVRFDVYDASFDWDPAHPEATRLSASVDPASLDVGADYSKEFAEEFLSVSKFPKATFVATTLQDQGGGKGTMTGDLTLMGVTKPVTFQVSFVGTGHEPLPLPFGVRAAGFSATTTFKRSDYGSTYLNNLVGDDITLDIEAEFDKK